VSNSPEVAKAVQTVLRKCAWAKISKKEDPRPAAVEWLRRSPAVSLPIVLEAAKHKNSAWAQELAPQLETPCARASEPSVAEAALDELPAPVTSSRTFKAPAFGCPMAFARPRTLSGKAFPRAAVETLGPSSQERDRRHRHDQGDVPFGLAQRVRVGSFSGVAFGERAVERQVGIHALGTSVTTIARASSRRSFARGPGSGASKSCEWLDVLAEIGSDVALMMLHGISQKLKFKGLQEQARKKMDEVAEKLGLTAGSWKIGSCPISTSKTMAPRTRLRPRSFRVGFDETLSPFVTDCLGARLKDLPKPNIKDEAELATAAVETWKAMRRTCARFPRSRFCDSSSPWPTSAMGSGGFRRLPRAPSADDSPGSAPRLGDLPRIGRTGGHVSRGRRPLLRQPR